MLSHKAVRKFSRLRFGACNVFGSVPEMELQNFKGEQGKRFSLSKMDKTEYSLAGRKTMEEYIYGKGKQIEFHVILP